jgi:hypothetical protein
MADCGNIFQDLSQGSLNAFGTGAVNYITATVTTANKLIGTVPAGRMIQRVHIDVVIPFDVPAFVDIGDSAVLARLWRFGDKESLLTGQIFTKFLDYRYNVPTQINWVFETLPSFGLATITIHFS